MKTLISSLREEQRLALDAAIKHETAKCLVHLCSFAATVIAVVEELAEHRHYMNGPGCVSRGWDVTSKPAGNEKPTVRNLPAQK